MHRLRWSENLSPSGRTGHPWASSPEQRDNTSSIFNQLKPWQNTLPYRKCQSAISEILPPTNRTRPCSFKVTCKTISIQAAISMILWRLARSWASTPALLRGAKGLAFIINLRESQTKETAVRRGNCLRMAVARSLTWARERCKTELMCNSEQGVAWQRPWEQ